MLPYSGIINKWCHKLGKACIHCCFYYTILCQLNAAVIFGVGWKLMDFASIGTNCLSSGPVHVRKNTFQQLGFVLQAVHYFFQ